MAEGPCSLYKLSVRAAGKNAHRVKLAFRLLPVALQSDVYCQLHEEGQFSVLAAELGDLDVVTNILRAGDRRIKCYRLFQTLKDEGHDLPTLLANRFSEKCQNCASPDRKSKLEDSQTLCSRGLTLGGFLSETGFFEAAEQIFVECYNLLDVRMVLHCHVALKCLTKLLHVRTANCKFSSARNTFDDAMEIVHKLQNKGEKVFTPALYGERCGLLFALSNYQEAYKSSMKALEQVRQALPIKVLVDVLRQASKACVVKRKFKKAELLIQQAMFLARQKYGEDHPKFADTLVDYGFYLLNVDAIHLSVKVYKMAFDIRSAVFGCGNLHVAIAHEDLAYALYVDEYSSGHFDEARLHAQKSIDIITKLFPQDHLLLASSKRVKALILEEIAIDCTSRTEEEVILREAQELHLSSLELAIKAFGENNIQTAKHYGNLGRLYQSMRRYEEAEKMHQKAIEIKEQILGSEDYEVALSLGHLASLYNYDMERYLNAEGLYLRSIAIGKKLFGESYSGLEYDYRGLINLYDQIGDNESMERYHMILLEWRELRVDAKQGEALLTETRQPWSTDELIQHLLSQAD